ncbi:MULTISPECIES: N-acetylmuramoyl-L-alanine amidase [unclassified Glutamicibacter]|uniref:peptidoglycan recognition protein family protein n=1 Tax=unclassified Glutamicibacter TaxID=2627139 RepID=UPI00381F0D8E
MAIYPGAKQRLIPKWNKVKIARHRRMNLHVAVSNAESLYGMFSRSNSACSHFYVAKDGTVEQYIDTQYRSASDMNGNDSTISVETAGGVTKPDSEPWTDAQEEALAKLWKWARDTHDIKNQVAKNTQTNDNSAGLSWHRLGVEGNFAGRKGILTTSYKPGGIKYSSARGKICPGDAKILQIPGIWSAANGDIGEAKPVASKPAKAKPKPAKVADQSPTNVPNRSTNFPDNYADLKINGNFLSWEIGALQILLENVVSGLNKQWDGKFEKLTITDTMTLMQRNGYYLKTPFAARGVAKGVPLAKDGIDGYWFWVEFQRMLGDDEGNRGKVYYDLDEYKLDGKPEEETGKAIQRWLNDNN